MIEAPNVALLIAGCRRREESSQLALYRHFYSYGMGICLRYAHSRESAKEMLNDGFLKVFQKIEQYDSEMPFKPWLRKVLVHAAIDHYRKYEKVRSDSFWLSESMPSTYNEASYQLDFDDLLKIVQTLPPAYRMVFNLYVVEELTHAEIAEKLEISVGTSKSNLAKARKKVQELVSRHQDIHLKSKRDG